jgi:hypothetical protein
MIDPTEWIGSLYKLPVLIYIGAICLIFTYQSFGIIGPITICAGAIFLVWRSYKKHQSAQFNF